MDFTWLQPEFSPTGVVLGLALLAYLVVFEPLLGMRSFGYLRRYRSQDPRALPRVYRRTLAVEAGWLVVVALILVVSPDLDPGAVGLSVPSGSLLAGAVGFTAFAVVAQVVVGLVFRHRGATVAAAGDYAYLLPVTPAERRLAGLVAVSAGVGEEVVVRGLLIALGVGAAGLPPLTAAVASTALFGFLHLYQGWSGVLYTTLLGAVLAGLYLATSSLLLPILLHVTVNTRALLITTYSGLPTERPPAP